MIIGILGHHGDSRFPFFPPVPVPGINRIAPVSTGTKSMVPDISPVPGPFRIYKIPTTKKYRPTANGRYTDHAGSPGRYISSPDIAILIADIFQAQMLSGKFLYFPA